MTNVRIKSNSAIVSGDVCLGQENPILRWERKWKGVGREGTVASEWETNHSEKFLVACRSVDARKFSFIRYNPLERERRRQRRAKLPSSFQRNLRKRASKEGRLEVRYEDGGTKKRGEEKTGRMEDKRGIKRERTCVVTCAHIISLNPI